MDSFQDTEEASENTKASALPKEPPPPKVKSILRQIADIARLHLATRPFMRFSLHITLCGTIFNICLFDRAGGVVSKDYDLKKKADFETFIRIIRRATCDMDAYELGLDPTVTPLGYLGSVARYPRFKVMVGENAYYTHDLPIWQSTTLQGRGTWVFGATKDDNPNPKPTERLILKNSWRASGRLPESTLYGIINKLQASSETPTLRCVAEFVEGGDVMAEEEVQQPSSGTSSKGNEEVVVMRVVMRVSSHRRFVVNADPNAHNPTLHRVVLATRGRSMVAYASLVELLSAAKCAAEGMQAIPLRRSRNSYVPKVFTALVSLG
jgi:Fungal protein kinase